MISLHSKIFNKNIKDNTTKGLNYSPLMYCGILEYAVQSYLWHEQSRFLLGLPQLLIHISLASIHWRVKLMCP